MDRVIVRNEERWRECPSCGFIAWTRHGRCAEPCNTELITLGECPGCNGLFSVADGELRAHLAECRKARLSMYKQGLK